MHLLSNQVWKLSSLLQYLVLCLLLSFLPADVYRHAKEVGNQQRSMDASPERQDILHHDHMSCLLKSDLGQKFQAGIL